MSTLAAPQLSVPPSATQRVLLISIQVLELLIIGGMSIPALLAERIAPASLLLGLSLLALPSLLRLLVSGRLTALTLTFWPLLLLFSVSMLTVYVTPAWQATWPEWVRLLWGMALCLAVVNWLNPWPEGSKVNREVWEPLSSRLIWATVAFFGLGFVLTAVGLLVTGPTHKFDLLDGWVALLPHWQMGAVTGFNPNRIAGVAVLLAPLALALAVGPLLPPARSVGVWGQWVLIKGAALVLTVGFCLALLLTQSRSAWLAFGCGLVVLLSTLGRRGWLLLAGLLLTGAIIVVAIGPTRLQQALTVYDLTQIRPDALIQDRNIAGRLILWQRALHGLADAPFTGMGLGAFVVLSQQPYPPLPAFKPDPDMSHVHNILLQVGLDFGLPGLLAFGSLLVLMGGQLIALVRRTNVTSPLHTWSRGLLGSFVAYAVYHMVDAITLGARPALMVWFLFGLCLGVGEWRNSLRQSSPRSRRQVRELTVGTGHDTLIVPLLSTPTGIADPARFPEHWEERAWAFTTKKTGADNQEQSQKRR